ncbi:relaxase/mobilization nuclease domain-containing protein [Streptomyces sp. NBC_01433]|uniref:relaxase/mobilization nuclease domain-containing protein n=1 Tax=Streptomyces sp. NBC_01433 TaxID=2903864 RepID=UPI002252932D|nr:mobilization protein [Streptomyces sp. NBC_01433]MCX4674327.1 relaxase/mobilization nuclease domain-containing protein [Streptomyces sp. NBC_01433]
MVPDISTGNDTRGLLAYAFGPGRRDEHLDPHLVAAWDMAGAPDPGRDPTATITQLAKRLDQYVTLATRERGTRPPNHVWHCPVRTAPTDRLLSDTEWAEVARRVVAAAGIAPEGDEQACRWVAVRHAKDHIHIIATSVRADGRRPRSNRDGQRAQAECRKIEKEFGLRQLKQGDGTAPKTPTGAERAKAERQGHAVTARAWLREQAHTAAAASRNEEDYFAILTDLGITVHTRIGPESGEVIGYSLSAPGDTAAGQPVKFGGSKLSPDLSIHRLRERFNAQSATPLTDPPTHPWQQAERTLRFAHAILTDPDADPHQAQGEIAAFADFLHTATLYAPRPTRTELRAAAVAFNRANRSAIRADHQAGHALRKAGQELLYGTHSAGEFVIAVLAAAIHLAVAAARWHEQRGHQQQAAAAHQALTHLRTAYQQQAAPILTELAHRTPPTETVARYEAALRTVLPTHADRILTDPAWPALATVLRRAETDGRRPAELLTEAAEGRELDTAELPAQVLIWRIGNTPDRRKAAATAASTVAARRSATSATAPLSADAKAHPTRRRGR